MRTWRWYSKLLFALLVAAFACFVWPTPWMYYPLDAGYRVLDEGGIIQATILVRISRFTGEESSTVPALRDKVCAKCGSGDLEVDWGDIEGGQFNRDVLSLKCRHCGYWWLLPSLDARK